MTGTPTPPGAESATQSVSWQEAAVVAESALLGAEARREALAEREAVSTLPDLEDGMIVLVEGHRFKIGDTDFRYDGPYPRVFLALLPVDKAAEDYVIENIAEAS